MHGCWAWTYYRLSSLPVAVARLTEARAALGAPNDLGEPGTVNDADHGRLGTSYTPNVGRRYLMRWIATTPHPSRRTPRDGV